MVGGPVYSTTLGAWMWEVKFDDGMVGWVAEEFLREATIEPPPTDGLVAYYPFDGTAQDISGSANNGTVYGAIPSSNRFDEPAKALAFDGINDYVTFPKKPVG